MIRSRLLVDLDSVTADIQAKWLSMYNELYQDSLRVNDIKSWNMELYVKPECGKKIYDLLNIDGFFRDLPVIEGAKEYLKKLHDQGFDIVFVSTSSINGYKDKAEWVDQHFPFISSKNLILTARKDCTKGDILYDDAPHNLEGFEGVTVKRPWPWNQNYHGEDYVAKTWKDFYRLVCKLYL